MQSAKSASAERAQQFSPGVRIDWQHRTVQVDTIIALRKGMLELLACSPNTREHESILTVQARPLDIYHAMGLIGLEPGTPTRHDVTRQRVIPATGDALDLRVRYLEGEKVRTVGVERWLLVRDGRRPPESLDWIFAGSRTMSDGSFAADLDGTIACVVDFETALIALGSAHSDDNELLWLDANTPAIPPLGTKCVLLIQGKSASAMKVELRPDGSLHRGAHALTVADVVHTVQNDTQNESPTRLQLHVGPGVSEATIESTLESLIHLGIKRRSVDVRRHDERGQFAPPKPNGSGGG